MKVKPLIMTENNYENSKQSTKCWICKKQYNKEYVKAKRSLADKCWSHYNVPKTVPKDTI